MHLLTQLDHAHQRVGVQPQAHEESMTLTRGHSGPVPADDYEPPLLIVIGNVRKLTTGSASSGKQDANSQYYW